jgi:hypothetical protein
VVCILEDSYIVGLYDAEGEQDLKRIYLVNSNFTIIIKSLEWFEKKFGVPKSKICIEIELPENYQFVLPDELRNFQVRIYTNRGIRKPCYKIRVMSKYYIEKFKELKQNIYLKILKELNDAKKLNYPNTIDFSKTALCYLQGIFDGDGSIHLIGMNSLLPMLFIETILLSVFKYNARIREGYSTKYVIHIKNKYLQNKLKEIKLFRFNYKRMAKLNNLKIKQIQLRGIDGLIKLLMILKTPKTKSEIFNLLNCECKFVVRKAIKLGLIKKYGKGTKYDPFNFIISDKGKNFINKILFLHEYYLNRRLRKIWRLIPA